MLSNTMKITKENRHIENYFKYNLDYNIGPKVKLNCINTKLFFKSKRGLESYYYQYYFK